MILVIPEELAEHLVGVWRFRQVASKPTWCTTFTLDGKFYDTVGTLKAQKAVDRAFRELNRAKRLRAQEKLSRAGPRSGREG